MLILDNINELDYWLLNEYNESILNNLNEYKVIFIKDWLASKDKV